MQRSSDNQTADTIELRHVTFSYRTGDPVLKDCSLTIHRGDFVILTGGSGSGKTKVTRLINGLGVQYYEGTQSGMVSVFGVNPEDTLDQRDCADCRQCLPESQDTALQCEHHIRADLRL